jgi:hypothetical protein
VPGRRWTGSLGVVVGWRAKPPALPLPAGTPRVTIPSTTERNDLPGWKCCIEGTLLGKATGRSEILSDSPTLDVRFHELRHAARMQDPEYREAYERAAREIAQTDAVIRELDALRVDLGISKAELARRVDRNASSVRRLFTARQARPELPLIAALADALGAELRVVRRSA